MKRNLSGDKVVQVACGDGYTIVCTASELRGNDSLRCCKLEGIESRQPDKENKLLDVLS